MDVWAVEYGNCYEGPTDSLYYSDLGEAEKMRDYIWEAIKTDFKQMYPDGIPYGDKVQEEEKTGDWWCLYQSYVELKAVDIETVFDPSQAASVIF